MTVRSQTVGVIGPTGFGGSYLSLELIQRGHKVVGISRHPEGLGEHPSYMPRAVDLDSVSIGELASVFHGLDVLISEYGPHTAGAGALLYMPFLEVVRRIVLAVQHAKVPYFIFVGGAGSLHVPNISDEVEERRYLHRHWTAVGNLSDDTTQCPSYRRL